MRIGCVNDFAVILQGSCRSPTEFLVVCQMYFSACYSAAGGGDEDNAVHSVDCEERVAR